MSSSTREVVTVQLGHYSNFVGTHWWNIQNSSFIYNPSQLTYPKEINNDILFREGRNLRGDVTYTPRLIAFDLKGSLNTLKQTGTLYDVVDSEDDVNWGNDVTLHKVDGAPRNKFLRDLDQNEAVLLGRKFPDENELIDDSRERDVATVNSEETDVTASASAVNTDNKLYRLDDSVQDGRQPVGEECGVRNHELANQQRKTEQGWLTLKNDVRDHEPFDLFTYGVDFYSTPRYKQEIEDRLHFFTEECDNLQGFQLLVDPFNGFGGLASSLLDDVADDFPNKAIMIFASTPSVFPNSSVQQAWHRIVNTASTYAHAIASTSLLLPLSMSSKLWQWTKNGPAVQLPNIQYRADLPYHTSAILASTIDCLTLPYRNIVNPSLMAHFTNGMMLGGRKIASVETAFPFPMSQSNSLLDVLSQFAASLPSVSLTPSCLPNIIPEAASAVVRGVPNSRLYSNESQRMVSRSVNDSVAEYFSRLWPTSLKAVCTIQQPCKVVAPFPLIFDERVGTNGFLSPNRRPADKGVESVPVMTVVRSSRSVRGHLEDLLSETLKLDIRRLHREAEAGLEADEIRENIDALRTHCQLYNDDDGDM